MLNRLQIKDFRCLREIDVPLKPLTVLIGPNNSGKSAFLAAVYTLGNPFIESRAPSYIAESDYWNFDSSGSPRISGFGSANERIVVEKASGNFGFGSSGDVWAGSGNESLVVPISYFDFSNLTPAMESPGSESHMGVLEIDNGATNLPAFLDSLLRKDRNRFLRVLETLQELIPGLNDVKIETPSAQSRRVDLELEDGIVMEARLASFGVKMMIFFVALANHPEPPSTILIEEPETGVHPQRLAEIVDLLVGLTQGRFAERQTQVILSTHSPYLLDCIDPIRDQVLVMQREEDGSRSAKPLDTERLKGFLDEFMLGEIWTNQKEEGLVKKGE